MPTRIEIERTKHHVWCNRHNMPREGCPVCEEFYEKYPPSQHMDELFFPSKHLFADKKASKVFKNTTGYDGRSNGNARKGRRKKQGSRDIAMCEV